MVIRKPDISRDVSLGVTQSTRSWVERSYHGLPADPIPKAAKRG